MSIEQLVPLKEERAKQVTKPISPLGENGVTRLEVIDEVGRAYVRWNEPSLLIKFSVWLEVSVNCWKRVAQV